MSQVDIIDLSTALAPQFRADFRELQKYISLYPNRKYIISTNSDIQSEIDTLGVDIQLIPQTDIHKGFIVGDTVVLTDYEILAKPPVIGPKKKSKYSSAPADFIPIDLDTMRPGDHVVHLKYGIAKFLEVRCIDWNGQKREYISLEYRSEEILNVPVEQMNLLSLYKGADNPKVSRLGGADWQKAKKSARASIQKVAEGLIELYAERNAKSGFAFEPDSPWQTELEDSFPYTETLDQLKAVNDVKRDMESDSIMDRLLCGDVGFGKTEVIIRAAFKAVMSGKQVAIMAPTTILAQQHYRSFLERLNQFPVRVDLFTRAQRSKVDIEDKLKQGEIDIVIGTHALLNKKIQFKDLGLLIVDEEQKFGVNHKEKLKKIKVNIDVLSVSATPIPRTLHMALSGIREMSLITTPPAGRVPIKTQLLKDNPSIIRAAILREIERGGQVFYLHNRVETIQQKAIELMQLVPEARFKIAHGQMPTSEAEETITDFINHEFDVLVATSIIENGLDIPNANTMIIERANYFGLSQLYQLRGRVGRSNNPSKPGHAILLYDSMDRLTDQSKQKLEAITRYSSLGSGYQIALRDMEIRGIGNMLGASQHGKVVAVGFELYCEMLNEAVQKMKLSGGTSLQIDDEVLLAEDKPIIDFVIEAYIPDSWLPDETDRLKEYQRLASISSTLQLSSLQHEWVDRFGQLPQSVCNLLLVTEVRMLATECKVQGLIKPNKQGFVELKLAIGFEQWKTLYKDLNRSTANRLAVRFEGDKLATIMAKLSNLESPEQLMVLKELFDKVLKL